MSTYHAKGWFRWREEFQTHWLSHRSPREHIRAKYASFELKSGGELVLNAMLIVSGYKRTHMSPKFEKVYKIILYQHTACEAVIRMSSPSMGQVLAAGRSSRARDRARSLSSQRCRSARRHGTGCGSLAGPAKPPGRSNSAEGGPASPSSRSRR